jgi:hypothetical protein
VSWVNKHCVFCPLSLSLSLGGSGRIWTLNIKILCQVFHHCTTRTQDLLTKLYFFLCNIFAKLTTVPWVNIQPICLHFFSLFEGFEPLIFDYVSSVLPLCCLGSLYFPLCNVFLIFAVLSLPVQEAAFEPTILGHIFWAAYDNLYIIQEFVYLLYLLFVVYLFLLFYLSNNLKAHLLGSF